MVVELTYTIDKPDSLGFSWFRVYEKTKTLGTIYPLLFETELSRKGADAISTIRDYLDNNGMSDLKFVIAEYLDCR